MTKKEQKAAAWKAYEAIEVPNLEAYEATQELAWEAYEAELKRINNEPDNEVRENLVQTLTADRLALLTELKEWTDNYLKSVNKYASHCDKESLTLFAYDAHSRKIATGHFKAHLDELIKSTSV